MDRVAVLLGGLLTGGLAVAVALTTGIPNVLLLGFLAGLVTGYRSDAWGDEPRDGAAAGALAGCLVLVVVFAIWTGGSVGGYLFVLIPVYAIEGLLASLVGVRLRKRFAPV